MRMVQEVNEQGSVGRFRRMVREEDSREWVRVQDGTCARSLASVYTSREGNSTWRRAKVSMHPPPEITRARKPRVPGFRVHLPRWKEHLANGEG